MTGGPFRLGLVGCGRLAEAGYVPALERAPGVELVAVADPDPIRRERVAAAAGAAGLGAPRMHRSASTLLARTDVDGLVLASPAAAHLDDAELAAGAGVAVLVEKPPAPDAAGAAVLTTLGDRVWVAFNRRFDPGAQTVRRQVPPDGPVDISVEIGFRRQSWGAHTARDDALLDLGPHLVDWVRWLAGVEITEVVEAVISYDRATVQLVHTRGRATLRAAADRIHREAIEVARPGGAIVARHRVGGALAAVRGRLPNGPSAHPLSASLASELGAFAAAARGDGATDDAHLGTARDGLAVMTVIDAARRCAAHGGEPTPVAPPVEI